MTFIKPLSALALVICVIYPSNQAQAGPAFKKLAEANNELYRAARHLGPEAKPSELLEAQTRIMGPAMAALNNEHYETYQKWKKSIKEVFSGTKDEVARLLGLGTGAKGASGAAVGAGPIVPVTPLGRQSAQSNTGEQGGGTGATGASFGGKRVDKNALKVDPATGIIMEQ